MIYFYPHPYLRDRQLDTVRYWPGDEVLNPESFIRREGAQAVAVTSKIHGVKRSWKQLLPLVNIKLRPHGLPPEAVVYIWGGMVTSGPYIVDLDTPWALVGYNLRAMYLYRFLIRRMLLSSRCREIRCMSRACRESLRHLFGDEVYDKAEVRYPKVKSAEGLASCSAGRFCSFLFVGSQFEMKGGASLLRAFERVYRQRVGLCRLDLVTHLPECYVEQASRCNGVEVHVANLPRERLFSRFMQRADVLVLPTFVESFGMVALEALAHSMVLIASDLYALGELVEHGSNGFLLEPPISIWDGVMPSRAYYRLHRFHCEIQKTDTSWFEKQLERYMLTCIDDPSWRCRARKASGDLLRRRFAC